jgi:probable phosphoglycerate mutase
LEHLPLIYLVRHGETAWTVTGQHTGRTDLPLTPHGEANARALGSRLQGIDFARVFTSPLRRAARTCELAGFGDRAEKDDDLMEWNYGEYEGLTGAEIRVRHPGWEPFRDGFPGGESFAEIGARADRVVGRLRAVNANVAVFSSGHLLRILASRWLGFDPRAGGSLLLSTASVGILTYEHTLSQPAIGLWNDTGHLAGVTH